MTTFSTNSVGVKVCVQDAHGGVRELVVGLAIVEVVGGDGESAGGEGAAIHLVLSAARVAAEDQVVIAEAVVAAEGEGPLVDVLVGCKRR